MVEGDLITVAVLDDVVHVGGEIDLVTAPSLDEALAGVDSALVDMTGVSFIDSTGIAVLVRHYQRCVAHGGVLRVVATSYPVRRVLEVCGLEQMLTGHEPPGPPPDPDPISPPARETLADGHHVLEVDASSFGGDSRA